MFPSGKQGEAGNQQVLKKTKKHIPEKHNSLHDVTQLHANAINQLISGALIFFFWTYRKFKKKKIPIIDDKCITVLLSHSKMYISISLCVFNFSWMLPLC